MALPFVQTGIFTTPCVHVIKCKKKNSRFSFKTVWTHFNLTLAFLLFVTVLEVLNLETFGWVHDATVSKSIILASLLTQHVEDWPLSFTLGSATGACQSRSLGPVLTMTSYPSVQGLSMSCLSSSSVPFWLENPSWPNSRTAQTVLLAHIKAPLIPNLQCDSPYSPCLLHNHSRSPLSFSRRQ